MTGERPWRTAVEPRPLDGQVLIRGEPAPFPSPSGSPSCPQSGAPRLQLESVVDTATGAIAHRLAMSERYQAIGWRYWRGATLLAAGADPNADGVALPVHAVDRRVGSCQALSWLGCTHEESVQVRLTEDQVRGGIWSGLTVRFQTPERNSVMQLEPAWLQTHLRAVDQVRSALPGGTIGSVR